MSKKQTTTTTTTASNHRRADAKRPRRVAPPWIEAGIDYGPAVAAIDELIAWAFDLAAASANDRESQRRVKNARRYIVAARRGKRTPTGVEADVMFTAALLVRILDADLKLGLGDIVEVFEAIGLPSVDVPFPPRRPAGAVRANPAPPTAAELATVIGALQRGAGIAPMSARPPVAPVAPIVPLRRPPAAVAPACAGCCHARPAFPVAA